MLISPIQVRDAIGIKQSWFQARFGHLVKDYLISNRSYYDVSECIAWGENYVSHTKNPKQKQESERMMNQCLTYLRSLNNA